MIYRSLNGAISRWAVAPNGMGRIAGRFYALLIPVMIAAGYGSVVGCRYYLIRRLGIGTLGSTINTFATYRCQCQQTFLYSALYCDFSSCLAGWFGLRCPMWCATAAKIKKSNPDYPLLLIISGYKGRNLVKKQTLQLSLSWRFLRRFGVGDFCLNLCGWWFGVYQVKAGGWQMGALVYCVRLCCGFCHLEWGKNLYRSLY